MNPQVLNEGRACKPRRLRPKGTGGRLRKAEDAKGLREEYSSTVAMPREGAASVSLLLIISQIAGVILLVGTLGLLGFRRIYLDAETKKPIKFSLPLFGEVSTQAPVLVLLLFGVLMVSYPLVKGESDKATIEGTIDPGGKTVTMLIVADPVHMRSQESAGKFKINVPLLLDQQSYRVRYIVDKVVIDDQQADLKNGITFRLGNVQWSAPVADDALAQITPKLEISNDELQRLGITH